MAADADERDIALDRVLVGIADAYPDRLEGWIREEPGHWGFFAGQAVLASRGDSGPADLAGP